MQKIKELFEAEAASPTETAGLMNGAVGFRVPEYQRPYDWAKANIERLFIDCLSGFHRLGTSTGADAYTFLGTLILVVDKQQEPTFGGKSVAIVDGQQRLTTLTLLASALFERLAMLSVDIDVLSLSPEVKLWLKTEVEDRSSELTDCALGAQKLKGNKTFPFPRIVRSGDQRGKSAQESEYRSALAKFLNAFADYVNSGSAEFEIPAIGTGSDAEKLGANFSLIRDLVQSLNDEAWYEDAECDVMPVGWISRAGYRALLERLGDSIPDESAQNTALSTLGNMPECHTLVRTLLFAAYFSRCVVLTRVITYDESAAFDIFDALNTTGEPLTALETLKPRVIQYENKKGKFAGSPSEDDLNRLHKYVNESFPDTTAKQGETKALVVSFGLLIDGKKLPENLASQRNFLRTGYDSATEKSQKNAQRFVHELANLAEFRHYYWSDVGVDSVGQFHQPERVDEIQLLISFLKATKTSLVLPILARYWRADMKQTGDSQFLDVLRTVTAFLVLRRAATGTTAGIDSDFRAIMAPKASGIRKFGLCAGVGHANKPLEVAELRAAFRILLLHCSAKITDRDKWIGQAIANPIYQQGREICRFMLLTAADQAVPSSTEPGCWTKDGVKKSSTQNVFLDLKTWRGPYYETVEHIAPDSEKHGDWDPDIYTDSIMRHSIGNLCLLPAKENGAIGNGSWKKKRLLYKALTEKTIVDQNARIDEMAAQGMALKATTKKILNDADRLSLLEPLRDVDVWTASVITRRGKNITRFVWDHLWPWLN